MTIGIFSYLITVVVFVGLAFLLYLVRMRLAKRSPKIKSRYLKIILRIILISLAMTTIGEAFALKWRLWIYDPGRTFNTIFLGAEIETYLFITGVAFVVSLATILYARREEEMSRN